MSVRPIKEKRENYVFLVCRGYSSHVIFVWGVGKGRDQQYCELPNAVFLTYSGVQSRYWSLRNKAVLISSIKVEDNNLCKTENYRRGCSLCMVIFS